MKTLVCLLWILRIVSGSWPDCIEHEKDFDGLDKLTGYRASSDGCAHWCEALQSRCVRWVYRDSPAKCFLKATEGNPREESAPLTLADVDGFKSKFGDPYNATVPEVLQRVEERKMELKEMHTGPSGCQPDVAVPWPDCAILGEEISGDDVTAVPSPVVKASMEGCSGACQAEGSCNFWMFDQQSQRCWLKTAKTTTTPNVNMFYGPKTCIGAAIENSLLGSVAVNGGWTPWSTLDTPCFSKKTGKKVECGGGIQYRHRSCTNPQPRFGGKKCAGADEDEHPCNLHNCALADEFLWSAWGAPDILCANGTQKRTTLCGELRRRLPPTGGRSADDPAVFWPTCIVPFQNNAPELAPPSSAATLKDCFNGCNTNADCNHWTFNLETKKCSFHDFLKIDSYEEQANYATGEKYCNGDQVYAPYCGEFMKNYPNVPVVKPAFEVPKYADCAGDCDQNAACHVWYLEISLLTDLNYCTLRGEVPAGETSVAVPTADVWAFVGTKADCPKGKATPAMPEDAQELSYMETCIGNQYQEMVKVNNTWNKEYCDSPCKNNGPCPPGAQCVDESDAIQPRYQCVCQMGMVMEGGRCISPPPTTPAPRPVPSLSPAIKDTVTALTRTASFVLISFVTATLILFAVLKIMDPGRFIHVNIEVALLLAHICLLPTLQGSEVGCRNISIFIHFFFTAVFAFYLMEGVYMYSLVSRVVPRNGMLSNLGTFMAGWGIAVAIITFTVSFEYDNYGGEYHCWLQFDTGLIYGQLIPIVILSIITFMLIEAGSNVDEDTMTKLPDTDETQVRSANYMLSTLLLRLGLTFASFVTGSVAEYEQNVGIYFIFTIVNGVLGGVIFFTHCSCNDQVRAKLMAAKEKVCGPKKRQETETESLVEDSSLIDESA